MTLEEYTAAIRSIASNDGIVTRGNLLVSTIVATRVREWAHAVGHLGPRTKSRAKRVVNTTRPDC